MTRIFVPLTPEQASTWAEIAEVSVSYDAVVGGRQPWCTKTTRPGSLRVSFPRGKNDLDAELRVLVGSTIP